MQQNTPIIIIDQTQYQSLLDKIDLIFHLLNSKPKETDELLSTKEAAKRLKVCSKTIISFIEGGKLKAIKFNKGEGRRGHYKLHKHELDTFVKSYRLGY